MAQLLATDWSGWRGWDRATDWGADSDGESDEEDFVEILPDAIKGWLLLEKASLDAMERQLIQSEIRGNFTLSAVENSLRSHFTDDAVRRKDGDARHGVMFGDEGEDEPPEEGLEVDDVMFASWSEETLAYYQQAKADEYEAWAQLQEARQTLREARARQQEVRMGRKFYDLSGKKGKGRGKRFPGGGKGAPAGRYGPCARCGKDHDTQFCPHKQSTGKDENAKNYEVAEASEFVYGTTQVHERANIDNGRLSTQQVSSKGYAVLDGGATKTMGSVDAVQKLQILSREQGRSALTHVDVDERPTFGFGNSAQDQCVSTCYVKVPVAEHPMSLKIHALDKGSAPILLSVDSLRKMGAIVDFAADEVIFTAINARKVVKLQRSAAGHQLLPLTDDFMSSGEVLKHDVRGLRHLAVE